MIILPLDPHLVDAAVEFEELGYLQTIDSVVEIRFQPQSPTPPPPSAASEFDANLMISVFLPNLLKFLMYFGGVEPLLVRM